VPKEDEIDHDTAARLVREEVSNYKKQLDQSRTKYRVVCENIQPDDSIILKMKKQYAGYSCGDYLD
jgi:hypothetical protein